ncbi:MAG TPA: cation-translocating P-type ATPase [Opitutaceae bacterium]|nr:cation-translocating P-type ATPase [Opitutaceae bacterium]
MTSADGHDGDWVGALVRFIREQPGVNAVRVDPGAHRVAVATIGRDTEADLEQRLAETIAAVEAGLSVARNAGAPLGYKLSRQGGATIVGRETCETAEKLWLWKEMAWPDAADARRKARVPDHWEEGGWRALALLAGGCAVAGIGGALAGWLLPGLPWLARSIYAVGLVAGGFDAALDSWKNLREGRIDIHFLMLAVAIGAVLVGAWGEAVILLTLFSAAGAMEEYALDRTQREVSALLKSAPKWATLVAPDGSENEIDVAGLRPGHRVRVKPGEAFAADGVVAKGESASDESTLTGEASPVSKAPGDEVFSGTVNLWGALEFEVSRLPSESTLERIIRLIKTAQKMRAPSERFTDRFGTGYTYMVIGGALAMFLVWWLGFGLPPFANGAGVRSAFYRAMTLMVVASPCALVLSIPSAILASIARGARHGILFRGGAAVERLADVDVVALDKTGTLTMGELSVERIESFPAGREREVLAMAGALEAKSQHPIARAILRRVRADGVRIEEVEEFRSITGKGLRGRIGGSALFLGRRELLEDGPLAEWARGLPPASAELSEVWVVEKELIGRVLLTDRIRAESAAVLRELKSMGVRTVMLTGDRRHAAELVARELGLDEVRAGLSPEEKVAAVRAIHDAGHTVAMVGDGVNDAPSLAAADVGVAMGARGSDAALEQAEVILMNDRIENFLAAHRLSRRSRAIIRQNLGISLGVVVVMVVATTFGAIPLAAGVVAHEGSTVVVCLNSLRLLFGKLR